MQWSGRFPNRPDPITTLAPSRLNTYKLSEILCYVNSLGYYLATHLMRERL